MSKGLIIIYIGDGKGKTTAAVGLAVRAAGAGKKVLFTQFVKAREARDSGEWPKSSEIAVLEKTPNIEVKIFGQGFVGILGDKKEKQEHAQAAKAGLEFLKYQVSSIKYQVVVADELVSAVELDLLTVAEVKELFKTAREHCEALVITGHKKYNELVAGADVVTEMKMIKHPYYEGRLAQKGIDY